MVGKDIFKIYLVVFSSKCFSRLLNGRELSNKDGVQLEKEINNDRYSLKIPKLTSAHTGVLSIKATNQLKSIENNLDIKVLGL